LFTRLEDARKAGRPIWIIAPAGSGKTALLASYCHTQPRPPIWYRFDEGDSDVGTFLHYFGRAVQHHALAQGANIEVRDSSSAKTAHAQRAYVRDLLDILSESTVLVLDDYHIVPGHSAMHALLAATLEEARPGLTLCVATRTPPEGTLARSYANSLVVDRDELRLSREEARALAHQSGVADEAVIDRALALSQGWASGLILLLRGLKIGRSPSAGSLDSPGLVRDFLASEVFPHLTDLEKRVLIACAFIPVVAPAAAARLSRQEEAGAVLQSLSDRQIFIDPLREADAYVFHPLLRGFLAQEAQRMLDPCDLVALKTASAEIMEEIGEDAELPGLLAGLGLWDRLAGFIERNASRLVTEGRAVMVESCIRRLPVEALNRSPWCRYWLGVCLVPRDMEAAQAQFETARSQMIDQGDNSGASDASRAALDALFWQWGSRGAEAGNWSRGLVAAFGRVNRLVPNFRGLLFGGFAMLTSEPAHAITRSLVEQAETLYAESRNAALRTQAATMLVAAYNIRGDHPRASAITAEAAHLADRDDVPVPIRLYWQTGIALQHWYIDGHGHAATEVAGKALALVRETGAVAFEHFLLATRGSAYLVSGDSARAEECYRALRGVSNSTRPMEVSREQYVLGSIHLFRGEHAAACEVLGNSVTLIERLPLFFVFVVQHRLAFIQALLAARRFDEALDQIAKAHAAADRAQSPWFRWQALIGESEALLALGREGESDKALTSALVLGRLKGIYSIPLISAARLAPLLDRAFVLGIEPDFVRQLAARHRVRPPQSESDQWPWSVRVYTLGRFELVVNDEAVRFARKAQKRPLDLLQALIAYGGRDVPASVLQDALWPDAEGDAAEKAFGITLLRLRRLLRDDASLQLTQRKLTLNPASCWVDYHALERLLGRIEAMLTAGAVTEAHTLFDLAERLLSLYKGPLLGTEGDAHWMLAARARIRERVSRALFRIARELRAQDLTERAETLYALLAQRDPLAGGLEGSAGASSPNPPLRRTPSRSAPISESPI
jgi:ATP/maltotriose-dependent transcriptional regulator MalT/DNA-binding SARP family transcriptional activator